MAAVRCVRWPAGVHPRKAATTHSDTNYLCRRGLSQPPPPLPGWNTRTSALLVASTIMSRRLAEPVLYSKAFRAFLVSSDMPGLDLLPKKASASSINRSRPLVRAIQVSSVVLVLLMSSYVEPTASGLTLLRSPQTLPSNFHLHRTGQLVLQVRKFGGVNYAREALPER